MFDHLNPVAQRITLACAICWPLAWALFMHLAPGPLAPPEPPSAPQRGRAAGAPPVDLTGSETVTQQQPTQGSIATSSGLRMFWEVPEPGHVRGRIEIDAESAGDEDPLVLRPGRRRR